MKGVLALLSTLLISLRLQNVAADCNDYKQFNSTLIPACDKKDLIVKWPNYEDMTSYYACYGVNNPKLVQCAKTPATQYFCFVLQSCGSCAQYIPPIDCSELPTENKANCVSMGQSTTPGGGGSSTDSPVITTSGLPTPNYPSETTPTTTKTTTTTTTTKTTASTASTPTTTTSTTSTTPGTGPPTPPTSGPTTATDIPPIPSPSTIDPSVPLPPTPPATPPNVPVEPPTNPPIPAQ